MARYAQLRAGHQLLARYLQGGEARHTLKCRSRGQHGRSLEDEKLGLFPEPPVENTGQKETRMTRELLYYHLKVGKGYCKEKCLNSEYSQ